MNHYEKKLLDHIIQTYYHKIYDEHKDDENILYKEFLKEVVRRTAVLVAKWQVIGWVHGVLNTDNMSIMGLTIDYGPFGFMESFDENFTPNGSDGGARYSYKRQPEMCKWNCGKLAEMLVPYIPTEDSKEIIDQVFDTTYSNEYRKLMCEKLGFPGTHEANGGNSNNNQNEIDKLIENLLVTLGKTNADYTDTFLALSKYASGEAARDVTLERLQSRCSPPKILEEQLRRKMRIMRLSMDPQQIMGLWSLLQEDPQKISAMFGGLPVEVIKNEIGGEKRKLDTLVESSQIIESLKELDNEAKATRDVATWKEFLDEYDKSLQNNPCDKFQRKEIMSKANPTFILRNWIAQIAIEKAERGDYTGVRTILSMLENPYDKKYDPFSTDGPGGATEYITEDEKTYLGLPPDWAAPLLCTCSS